MEDKISKILKEAKSIKPEPAFRERVRQLILSSNQKSRYSLPGIQARLMENLKFGLALVMAGVLLFFSFGGFNYFKSLSQRHSVTAQKSLQKELDDLDFQIQLKEIKYFDESAQEIAILLKEIKDQKGTSKAPLN